MVACCCGIGAVAALALVVGYVVVQQIRNNYPAQYDWPQRFLRFEYMPWVAVLLLVADVVLDYVPGRGSAHRSGGRNLGDELVRFTVVGHSCLYVETSAGTILVDPWLLGSCYWRSWWHFPPSADVQPEWFNPDYIYLTHHHFDHFHYPSMRKMDRRVHVLVPRFGVDVMEGEVRGLGFGRVTELPHGQVAELGGGVRVASFQYGFDDTSSSSPTATTSSSTSTTARSAADRSNAWSRSSAIRRSCSRATRSPRATRSRTPPRTRPTSSC